MFEGHVIVVFRVGSSTSRRVNVLIFHNHRALSVPFTHVREVLTHVNDFHKRRDVQMCYSNFVKRQLQLEASSKTETPQHELRDPTVMKLSQQQQELLEKMKELEKELGKEKETVKKMKEKVGKGEKRKSNLQIEDQGPKKSKNNASLEQTTPRENESSHHCSCSHEPPPPPCQHTSAPYPTTLPSSPLPYPTTAAPSMSLSFSPSYPMLSYPPPPVQAPIAHLHRCTEAHLQSASASYWPPPTSSFSSMPSQGAFPYPYLYPYFHPL